MSSDSKDRPPPSKPKPARLSTVLYQEIPETVALSTADKRVLRQFTASLTHEVARGRSFVCLMTNDEALRRLNHSFRGKDYPTDVLSFPSSDADLGDIAISVERADEQAKQFGHSRVDEIRILMLHGLLHLTGMDHETDEGAMAAAEELWRKKFGLPAALIERSDPEEGIR